MSFVSLWGNWRVGISIPKKNVEEIHTTETKDTDKKETVIHTVETTNTEQPVIETQTEVKKTVKRSKKLDNTEL